jgi:hypothetical protein
MHIQPQCTGRGAALASGTASSRRTRHEAHARRAAAATVHGVGGAHHGLPHQGRGGCGGGWSGRLTSAPGGRAHAPTFPSLRAAASPLPSPPRKSQPTPRPAPPLAPPLPGRTVWLCPTPRISPCPLALAGLAAEAATAITPPAMRAMPGSAAAPRASSSASADACSRKGEVGAAHVSVGLRPGSHPLPHLCAPRPPHITRTGHTAAVCCAPPSPPPAP